MKQEGPKVIVIPEQRFLSCYGCEHHKYNLIHSGRDPKYAHNCEHPNSPFKANQMVGNLDKNEDGHIKTPGWCPLLPKKSKEDVGSYGHGTSGNFQRTQGEEHGGYTE